MISIGVLSYHTKRRFHHKIAFGLRITNLVATPNLFLMYFRTDVTSDRALSEQFK